MRVVALMLTLISGAAALWFGAIAARIVLPGAGDGGIVDPYYAIANARTGLPLLLLACANAAGVALAAGRGRQTGRWIVLAGVALLLACFGAELWLVAEAPSTRIPEHSSDYPAHYLRMVGSRYLAWLALGLLVAGWITHGVSRRGRGQGERIAP